MTHVKEKHMTRWGLEPGTYHSLPVLQYIRQGSCTPSKVCLDITRHIEKKGFIVTELI